jgi:hypothetical protein
VIGLKKSITLFKEYKLFQKDHLEKHLTHLLILYSIFSEIFDLPEQTVPVIITAVFILSPILISYIIFSGQTAYSYSPVRR